MARDPTRRRLLVLHHRAGGVSLRPILRDRRQARRVRAGPLEPATASGIAGGAPQLTRGPANHGVRALARLVAMVLERGVSRLLRILHGRRRRLLRESLDSGG